MARRRSTGRGAPEPPRVPKGPVAAGPERPTAGPWRGAVPGGPSLEEWRSLYAAAIRVRELAPWEWMTETEVFGVRDPGTGQVGYVSVMGRLGEHLSVAVYLGGLGLAGFCGMQEIGSLRVPEEVLDTPHLQASFEDRDLLEKEDLQVVKALGLSFSGHHAWPLFRSYRPGYLPWLLEGPEARFLNVVLNQLIDLAPRLEDGTLDLDANFWLAPPERLLVRSAHVAADGIEWSEAWEDVVLPEPVAVPVEVDEVALARLGRLPIRDMVVEVLFELAPFAVHGRGKRPYAPRLLLAVDADSGFILGSETVEPQATPEHALAKVPGLLARLLAKRQLRPRLVRVRAERLAQALEAGLAGLDLPIEEAFDLPAAEEVLASLARFTR